MAQDDIYDAEGGSPVYDSAAARNRAESSFRQGQRDDVCIKCHQKPKNLPHQFCSLNCAQMCEIPDCEEKRYSQTSRYCSQVHRKTAVQLGLATPCQRCGIFPQMQGDVYCGKTCASRAVYGMTGGGANDARHGVRTTVPQPPHAFLKPRTAYQISFGELNGKPSYLLRSQLGMDWSNLPRALDALCKRLVQASSTHAVLDFSLGAQGRYYFVYTEGPLVKTETSEELWSQIDEDFHGGSIRQLEFGTPGMAWGIKSYRKYEEPAGTTGKETEPTSESPANAGCFSFLSRWSPGASTSLAPGPSTPTKFKVVEEVFGRIPQSLVVRAGDLYPNLRHYGQVDFITVGPNGAWCAGIMGRLMFWEGVHAQVLKQVLRLWKNCGRIVNMELSPLEHDIYFIEAKDGTVAYHVPDAWHDKIRLHLHHQHQLEHGGPAAQPRRQHHTPYQPPVPRHRAPAIGVPGPSSGPMPAPTRAPSLPIPSIPNSAELYAEQSRQRRPRVEVPLTSVQQSDGGANQLQWDDVLPVYGDTAHDDSSFDQPIDMMMDIDPPEYEVVPIEDPGQPIGTFSKDTPISGVIQSVPDPTGEFDFMEMAVETPRAIVHATRAPVLSLGHVAEDAAGCCIM